jgi:uncharacterized membrane protein YhaH (DUF805 family)
MAREPRFTLWLRASLVIAAAWWLWDLAVLGAGVPHPLDDHWEDQIVAEHLLRGEAFRTRMLYPPLWQFRDPLSRTIPVLVHGPLLPLVTVPALKFLGRDALDRLALPVAVVAWLTVIPLFRLGTRHFGPPVGFAAAFLYTCSPLTLEAVHHSGSVIVGAFCLAWTLNLLARPRPRPFFGGLWLGVGYLVRPELLVAAPVLAAFTLWQAHATHRAQRLFEGRRPRLDDVAPDHTGSRPALPPAPEPGMPISPMGAALLFVAAFTAGAFPWWLHLQHSTGNPFFNLTSYTLIGYWNGYPGPSVLQDFSLTPDRWPAVLAEHLPLMTAKWAAFAPRALKHLLFTPSGTTGWLAIVGLIVTLATTRTEGRSAEERRLADRGRLAWLALFLVLIPAASMTLTQHQRLYVVPFSTLLALGAAAGAAALGSRMPDWGRRDRLWIGLLILITVPVSFPAARAAGQEARLLEVRLAAERRALKAEFESFGRDSFLGPDIPHRYVPPPVLFSDSPDFVAWTTGLPTFWSSREAFAELYPPEGPGLAPQFGLPPRDQVEGWFHDDVRDPTATGSRVSPHSGPINDRPQAR